MGSAPLFFAKKQKVFILGIIKTPNPTKYTFSSPFEKIFVKIKTFPLLIKTFVV